MTEVDRELDLSGLNCPMPILKTKAAFATMAPGQVIRVTANNPDFVKEVNVFSRQMGHKILKTREKDGVYDFWLEKV